MKAIVQAFAVCVSDSVFGQLWRQFGAFLDIVIPLVLFAIILIAGGAVFFNFVH